MVTHRLIGIGTTNSNGVAHLTHDAEGQQLATMGYKGKGNGKVDIVASPDNMISNSSDVSGTYPVTDAKGIYNGTSVQTANLTVTPNSDGSYTIGTDGTNYGIFTFSQTTAHSGDIFVDIGGAFEFDLISYSGQAELRSNISGGSNRGANNIWNNNTHYKIEIIDNGVKVNGVTKIFGDTGARLFQVRVENNATFTIKNLLYY